MSLTEIAPPDAARLPIADLRDFLRLGRGFGDDEAQDPLLDTCLRGAMAAIEARLSLGLLSRDYLWVLHYWRSQEPLVLPRAPLRAVAAFRLVAASGAVSLVEAGRYRWGTDERGAFLAMNSGTMPHLATGAHGELEFTAGFGDWADIPADLQQAWLRLAAQFYEHRHGGEKPGLPLAVLALIEPYLPRRMGARR